MCECLYLCSSVKLAYGKNAVLHLRTMSSVYKNQLIDLYQRPNGWFCYKEVLALKGLFQMCSPVFLK